MRISLGISGCTCWVFVGSLLVKAGSDGNFSGTWVFHGTSVVENKSTVYRSDIRNSYFTLSFFCSTSCCVPALTRLGKP